MLRLAALTAFLGCVIAAAAVDQLQIVLEHKLGVDGEWAERLSVPVERLPSGKWPHVVQTAGGFGVAKGTWDTEAAVQAGALYFLRARGAGSAASSAVASVPACLLRDANLRHDVALHVNAQGQVVSVDMKLRLPAGHAGACKPGGAGWPATAFKGKLLLDAPEDVAPIPAVLQGKGAPLPGQPEVTEQDVAYAAALESDPDAAAAAAAAGEKVKAKEAEAPKSFFAQYWHLIVPGMLAYMFLSGGGGGGGGGGAAGAPRAGGGNGGAR